MRRSSLAVTTTFAAVIGSAAMLAQAPNALAGPTYVQFGDSQTGSWTVPLGVTDVVVHAVGGSGGETGYKPGGRGADVTAELTVTPGQTMSVHVAGNGSGNGPGANGGGEPGWYIADGGGGGASDVRIGGDDPADRVLVAGGGGGASQNGDPEVQGGDAGAPGGNSLATYCGGTAAQPGTESAGGAGGVACGGYSNGQPGTLGQGGIGAHQNGRGSPGGGGGGGGYYGGGSGGDYQGGAGGSSYVTPDAIDQSIGLTDYYTSPYVRISWVTPPAADVQVSADSATLPADGTSTTTVTATVVDEYEQPTPGDEVAFSSDDPGVTFGAVTDHGDGTYSTMATASHIAHDVTITASDGTASGSATVTQQPLPQTVVFGMAPDAPKVGDTYVATATGGDSGNPIVLSIDSATADKCSVDGSMVSFEHAGDCTIVADQAGDATFAAGHETQTLTIGPNTGAITFISSPSADPVVGGTYTVTAAGSGSTEPVELSISDDSAAVCSISGSTVSFLHAGDCTVVADQAGDGDVTAAHATQPIVVARRQSVTTVTLDRASAVTGQTVRPTATVRNGATAAGSVQFAVDAEPVGAPVVVADGTAVGPALTIAVGSHIVSATFSPSDDQADAPSSGPAALLVTPAATTTTLTVVARSLSATVAPVAPGAGSPSGTVQFRVGGFVVGSAPIAGGIASLAVTVPSGAVRTVSALYSGDAGFNASSDSAARRDPVITANRISSTPPSAAGWYRSSVRVEFTCTIAGAPLTAPCPAPVLLTGNGAGQTVKRTIAATDGGVATVSVPVNIDRTAPTVLLRGIANGGRYFSAAPRATCTGIDGLSGVQSCSVALTRGAAGTVSYVATAVDRAGNRSSVQGRYTVTNLALVGAPYSDGAYTVSLGQTIQLQYIGTTRPRYVDAAPAPRRPQGLDMFFYPAGSTPAGPRWVLGVTITTQLHTHRYWNIGVKAGNTVQVLLIRIRGI